MVEKRRGGDTYHSERAGKKPVRGSINQQQYPRTTKAIATNRSADAAVTIQSKCNKSRLRETAADAMNPAPHELDKQRITPQ